jgi:hypothetical protein
VGCQHQQEVVERRSRPLVVVEALGPAAVPAVEHSIDSMPRSSGIHRTLHTDLHLHPQLHQHRHHSTGHTELHSRLASVQSLGVQASKQQENIAVRSCLGIGSNSSLDLSRHHTSLDLHDSSCRRRRRMSCCSHLLHIHRCKIPFAEVVGSL